MPKLCTRPPKYSRHKSSGQAVVKFNGRVRYLGPYGSQESKLHYQEAIAEWSRLQRQPGVLAATVAVDTPVLMVSELILRYYRHALRYYRDKRGKSTGTAEGMKPVLKLLRATFGNTPVSDFGPLSLQHLQQKMVERDWSRTYVNMNTARVKRMFKWGTAQELVPAGVMQRLEAVQGLKAGRTAARETAPVEPVADEIVDATLPYLPPVVADMVRFQRLVGCRPTETCTVRPCDVDRSGDIWTYRPDSHKTEHHNLQRAVYIGPRAQAILHPYLLREASSFCFSPKDGEKKRLEAAHGQRKTPLSYGNRPGSNRVRRPARQPGERYTKDSFNRAIKRSVDKANRHRVEEQLPPLPHWAPNQLRHTAGTEIRKQYGLEAAQVVLGHSRADTTQIYAERDRQLALNVVKNLG